MTHKVFVYGTLKRGLHNNHFLKAAEFVGRARTVNRFVMSDGPFPYMAGLDQFMPMERQRMRAFAGHVYGEVYAVDDATLAQLDELEGTPTHYTRETLWVELAPGRDICAFGYLIANAGRMIAADLLAPGRNAVLTWPMANTLKRRVRS